MSSIDNQLTSELNRLSQMDKIQKELMTLEKSLNNCIDLTSSSVKNEKLTQYYEQLRIDNLNSFNKSNQELDNEIDKSRKTISELSDKKEEEEKEKKDE